MNFIFDADNPNMIATMLEISQILPQRLQFDAAADVDAWSKAAPARWVVYLFADQQDRPVQLLCVRNLRQSLRRRLGGDETIGLGRRVNYRELIGAIYYRRVDSAFEADVIYYEAARAVFPETYRGMVGFRPAWFVHINPEANFPRFTKICDFAGRSGNLIGPLEDKHVAARLIDLLIDGFDLCRYYALLIQAPEARACAYKEMGKCPAPCDGSISMPQYRRLVDMSLQAAIDPGPLMEEQQLRMRQAAGDLKFELAQRIKKYIEQLSPLGHGPFRHVRRLEDFRFLSVQRGPEADLARLCLIFNGELIQPMPPIKLDSSPAEVLRTILPLAENFPPRSVVDTAAAERIGIVTRHLFSGKAGGGAFLPLADISEQSLARALRDLRKLAPEQVGEDEGVLKELQAMG